MSTYTLIPGGDGRYSDAIMKAAGSFSRSMTKKKRKLKEDVNSAGFGFAPMDLLLQTKGGTNGNVPQESESCDDGVDC